MSLYGKPTSYSGTNSSGDSGAAKTINFSLESFFNIWFLYMFVVTILDAAIYLIYVFLDDCNLLIMKKGGVIFYPDSLIPIEIIVAVCTILWCLLMLYLRKNNNKILLLIYLIAIIMIIVKRSLPIDYESTHWIFLALQAPAHPFEWITNIFLIWNRPLNSEGFWFFYDHIFTYLQGLVAVGVTILAMVARKPSNKSVRP